MSDTHITARAREVLREAQPPMKRFWPAIAAGFGTAVSAIALLAASAWLITRAAEQPLLLYLSASIVAVRAFALGRGFFRYLERLWGHDAALGQLATVRATLVRRLVPLAPDGLGRARRGALLSNLVDDVEELQNLPLRVVMPLSVAGLASIASVIFVAVFSPIAALVLTLSLTLALALAVWVGWAAGAHAEHAIAPLRSRLADALVDQLTALDVLTAYGAADTAAARIRDADNALRTATVRRATAQGLTSGAVSLLAGVASLAILWATLPGFAEGTLTGPGLAIVVLLPMAIFEVFGPVPLALASWRQVRAAAVRIAETVPARIPPEIPSVNPARGTEVGSAGSGSGILMDTVLIDEKAPRAGAVSVRAGAAPLLELSDLSARWPQRANDASEATLDGQLSDVSTRFAPGERVLIAGQSGAGKTTLAHVLVRFLNYEGSFCIDGVEARSLHADAVRATIGLCEQDPYIFDETLRQNLLFAHDSASDADLWIVLERVGLAEWARERGGLDATLGERGGLVSGGQAQRIALARALLADFPVLVLDEPTAGVDPEASDALLRDLLTAVPADRTVIVISHVAVPDSLIDRTLRLVAGRLT